MTWPTKADVWPLVVRVCDEASSETRIRHRAETLATDLDVPTLQRLAAEYLTKEARALRRTRGG